MTTGTYAADFKPRGADFCSSGNVNQIRIRKSWSGGDRILGEDPNTPHYFSMNYTYRDDGFVQDKTTGDTAVFVRCYGGVPAPSLYTWSSSDELELLGKLADKVRSHDFNAGVFAGTGHQTANMIGDSALRLANGYRALKRGLGTKAIVHALNGTRGHSTGRGRSLPRDPEHRDVELSRRWLEASYGWMPLLSDVHEACKALAIHVAGVRRTKFRVRVTRHSFVEFPPPPPYGGKTGFGYRTYGKQIIYEVLSERNLLNELSELGLTDPLQIGWELLPWSFAIDWFLPVGDFLSTCSVVRALDGRYTTTTKHTYYGEAGLSTNHYAKVVDKPKARDVTVSRTVTLGPPPVPFPGLKSPFSPSWKRAANQIAVLAGLRSRY